MFGLKNTQNLFSRYKKTKTLSLLKCALEPTCIKADLPSCSHAAVLQNTPVNSSHISLQKERVVTKAAF